MDFILILIVGLFGGYVGAFAMHLSQKFEMKMAGRNSSTIPVKVLGKLLGFDAKDLDSQKRNYYNFLFHYTYSSLAGFVLYVVNIIFSLNFVPTLFVYFVLILLPNWTLLPLWGLAKPFYKWELSSFLIDTLHHAVYSFVTLLVHVQTAYLFNINQTSVMILRLGIGLTMVSFGVNQFLKPASWLSYLPERVNKIVPLSEKFIMKLHSLGNIFLGLMLILGIFTLISAWVSFIWFVSILFFAFRREWRIGMRDLSIAFALLALIYILNP